MNARGSCASVADSAGNLLLYAATPDDSTWKSSNIFYDYGVVRNQNHAIVANGAYLVGTGWYHEITIIPFPGNDSLYYIFSIGVTGPTDLGLYYSIVNIAKDSVIQKNIQLMPDKQADCIYAVKHGNGRDWWVVGRRFIPPQWNNEYWRVLVTPNGVYGPFFQNIGDTIYSDFCRISFSPTGDTLLFTNAGDVIQYFHFDRCTGLLSNTSTIKHTLWQGYFEWIWSNEFSSDGRFIYASTSKDTTKLYQFDLLSPNPYLSRILLYQSPFPRYSGGDVKRGPDGKIYFSIAYITNQVSYPYPDSVYNNYNMYLSVINQPDSLGAACDFQPYSFYLGGKRTYYGLPNNPDYHLGPKIGSGCDTLTAINEHSQNLIISKLSPNPNNGEFTVNYFLPNGKSGELEVFNLTGQRIFYQPLPRYTYMQYIELKNQPEGIYLLKISGGGKVAVRKFVVSE